MTRPFAPDCRPGLTGVPIEVDTLQEMEFIDATSRYRPMSDLDRVAACALEQHGDGYPSTGALSSRRSGRQIEAIPYHGRTRGGHFYTGFEDLEKSCVVKEQIGRAHV